MYEALKKAIENDPIMTDRRQDLIEKIRPIAHPQTFEKILTFPTAGLRSFLIDYHTKRIRNEAIREVWG